MDRWVGGSVCRCVGVSVCRCVGVSVCRSARLRVASEHLLSYYVLVRTTYARTYLLTTYRCLLIHLHEVAR